MWILLHQIILNFQNVLPISILQCGKTKRASQKLLHKWSRPELPLVLKKTTEFNFKKGIMAHHLQNNADSDVCRIVVQYLKQR